MAKRKKIKIRWIFLGCIVLTFLTIWTPKIVRAVIYVQQTFPFFCYLSGVRYNIIDDVYYVGFSTWGTVYRIDFEIKIKHNEIFADTYGAEVANRVFRNYFNDKLSELFGEQITAIVENQYAHTTPENYRNMQTLAFSQLQQMDFGEQYIEISLNEPATEVRAKDILLAMCAEWESLGFDNFYIRVFFHLEEKDETWCLAKYSNQSEINQYVFSGNMRKEFEEEAKEQEKRHT